MKRGFTLTEILVAMACGVLLIVTLYGVYVTSYQSYRRSVNQAELAQNARVGLERISRDLRQTDRITTELPPDDTDLQNPPPSYIQFQDGHDTAKIQYIKYYLTDHNLKRQVIHYSFSSDPDTWVAWNTVGADEIIDPALDVIKADKVSAIEFYGVKLITIELTVSDEQSTFYFKTQVLGRNIQ